MAQRELNVRDLKLVQYLTEAYGKERQLETALQAHIGMTDRAPYKKRLQDHLKETRAHAKQVERRIKQLGAPAPNVAVAAVTKASGAVGKATALAQGPMHALRGTGAEEKLLKNAKDEFADEAEEIATYTAIETLANEVGDKETARLAKTIRREEERMSGFLQRLIPQLTKAVAKAEIPAAQRNGSAPKRRRPAAAKRRPAKPASRGAAKGARGRAPRSGARAQAKRRAPARPR
jgi:ferritin-like metal-binding protein YciE